MIKAESDDTFIIALQVFENDKKMRYFIIDKKIDQTYGPLNEADFYKLKAKMGIEINFE
ncbi:hypothetical protein D3C85_1818570 [compost metagenome]